MKTPKSPKVKLHVTQEILDSAEKRNSSHCAIAEALKAAYPGAKSVSVDLATIRFTDAQKGCRYTYMTPRIAQAFIVNYDQGRESVPFDFQVRAGQVTRSSNTRTPKKMTEKGREQRRKAGLKLNETLRKSRMVLRDKISGDVAERIGGKTPPLQSGSDGVPFSRRRAFGLRGLEF